MEDMISIITLLAPIEDKGTLSNKLFINAV